MDLLKVAKAHVGATAALAVVVLGGAGVATAAVVVTPAASTDEVFDAPEATTPAATTDAPAPVVAPVVEPVVEPVAPVEEPPAATVDDVTEPTADQPEAPVVAEGVGATGADGRYTPAPPRQNPGEPPVIDNASSGADGELLPGEPGYVAPTG